MYNTKPECLPLPSQSLARSQCAQEMPKRTPDIPFTMFALQDNIDRLQKAAEALLIKIDPFLVPLSDKVVGGCSDLKEPEEIRVPIANDLNMKSNVVRSIARKLEDACSRVGV